MVETARYYLDFRDHHGTRQRFRGDMDKRATEALACWIEDLVHCRRRKREPKDKLWNWLMGLPMDLQERLIKLDLAEREWFPAFRQSERLADWINDFEDWLKTSKTKSGFRRNANHVACTMGRIRAIADGCGFKTWTDITKAKVETFLGGLDVSEATNNAYVTSIKHFTNWIVDEERAEYSPLRKLERVTVPDKERRRPLGADEVTRLLRSTVNAPKRYGLTGFERAVLYRLGIETGYRANELRHLTPACFDLDKATVSQEARHCKDRRDAVQPITMALASRLGGFLGGMDSASPVFYVTDKGAKMIQADATEAGLPLVDDEGRGLVFHSLRHTLRTELVRARVSEAVIDEILRHKDPGVGRRFYTHLAPFEIREAIERLPVYPWPGDLQQQAKKAVS